MMFEYLSGDATSPNGQGTRIIVHCCNDSKKWGAGFVLALSRRWKEPEAEYRRWADSGAQTFKLGEVQFVSVEPELWVANLIGQHGTRSARNLVPVRYEALRAGLAKVAIFAREHGASVHLPRLGAGLAGGDWTVISLIIAEELADISVTVYDLPKQGKF